MCSTSDPMSCHCLIQKYLSVILATEHAVTPLIVSYPPFRFVDDICFV